MILLLLLSFVIVVVKLQIVDGILLAIEQKAYLVVDELKLPSHFLVDIINFVHGAYRAVNALEIGEVLVEGVLHPALFFLGKGASLLTSDCLLEQIFLAGVRDEQRCGLFEGFLGLESVQHD